ncbi:MAG: pentapeptide repeat-containing protein [Nostocaceae cyanobacterium]|nr:pentapeptide repeat-containing protein [Nostocaceae cyanobacterium]
MLFDTKKPASIRKGSLLFLLIGFVAVLLIFGSIVWQFSIHPIQQIQASSNPLSGKDFFELRNQSIIAVIEFLKLIAISFCGIAIFCNIYYAAKRSELMDKTAIITLDNAKAALQTAQATIEKQIKERFAQALEMLGNHNIETRLGAIYTLEQIAVDSPQDHWTIMEILAAFVRHNAPLQVNVSKGIHPKKQQAPKLRTDIQVALTVLGRRNYQQDPANKYLDLSNIDISGAVLNKAYLQGANLKNANLQAVDFSDANLQNACLEAANLEKAKLAVANLQQTQMKSANLPNASLFLANLSLANLDSANLQAVEFTGANLQATNLNGANLQGAKIFVVKNLEAEQIEKAYGDNTTKLPENIKPPAHWQRNLPSSKVSHSEPEISLAAEVFTFGTGE